MALEICCQNVFPKKAVPIYNVISHTAEDPLHCFGPVSITVKTVWNLPKQKLVNVSSGYLGASK